MFFYVFLANISLENYFLWGISMYVSYMLCSEKEDFFGSILTKMDVLNSTFRVNVTRTPD